MEAERRARLNGAMAGPVGPPFGADTTAVTPPTALTRESLTVPLSPQRRTSEPPEVQDGGVGYVQPQEIPDQPKPFTRPGVQGADAAVGMKQLYDHVTEQLTVVDSGESVAPFPPPRLPPQNTAHTPPVTLRRFAYRQDYPVSSITGSGIEISAPEKMGGRRRARTVIGRALLKNIADIDVLAQSLILLIEEKIDQLKHTVPPNEPEAWEAHHKAIAEYEKLRLRVEAFIETASGFTAGKVTESAINKAVKSFAKGVGDWWSEERVMICNAGLFGVLFTICSLGGAGGVLSALVPGVIVKGKLVTDAITSAAKISNAAGGK